MVSNNKSETTLRFEMRYHGLYSKCLRFNTTLVKLFRGSFYGGAEVKLTSPHLKLVRIRLET